jgi:2-methylcitrate dehydratase PrpD
MKSQSLSRNLAEFVEELVYKDLPQDVIERAKVSILNVFTGCFAGRDLPWVQVALKSIEGSHGQATIWVYGHKSGPAEAAMVNAVMAHGVMLEDFAPGIGHPGDTIIPAAIAVAEENASSGTELIAAVVAGYDVLERVGLRFGNKLHSAFGESSVLGNFGSVASASKLLKLSQDQISSALGYAATFASGLQEHWVYGSMEGMFQMGAGARNGVFLSNLAQNGAIAAETALEGQFGFYQAFTGSNGDPVQAAVSHSSEKYAIMKTFIKQYPSCGANQVTLDMGSSLHEKYQIKAEDIEKIKQRVSPHFLSGPGNNFAGPFKNQFQAQMSTQFCLAAALIGKPVKSPDLYIHHFNDTVILETAGKVELIPEGGRTWFNPRIEVYLKNGKQHVADENKLDKFIPNWKMAVEAFKSHAGQFLGQANTASVIDMVFNLEKLDNISKLTSLLQRS